MNEIGGGWDGGDRYAEVPFLNSFAIENIATAHASTIEVSDSFAAYVSQASEVYLLQLLEKMCAAAECRGTLDFNVFKENAATDDDGGVVLEVEALDDIRAALLEM